ncbi:hypothetical protein ACFSKJ_00295 [Tabrizicola soli]|uniref:hypothetical protein n=1 Tax=Tabrizicola soli TaxID=2185115 RepID=UPI00363898FB
MSRDLTPDFALALAERDLRPVIFFEGHFASGPLRLWSGLGEIGWAGESWSGAGALLGLGAIEETSEVVAGGTSVSLSGIPPHLVQLAIAEARQGLPGRVWLGLLTPRAGSSPIQSWPSPGASMCPRSPMTRRAAGSPSATNPA